MVVDIAEIRQQAPAADTSFSGREHGEQRVHGTVEVGHLAAQLVDPITRSDGATEHDGLEVFDVLLQGLALCLKELARGERLPANIYVCGGGSMLPELMSELTKNAWTEGLPFARPPEARLLQPSDVRSLTDTTGQLQSPQDVGPLGLANHALRVEAEDRDLVNTVMGKVLKAMKV